METEQLHKIINDVYQNITNKWLRFHMGLLALCAAISSFAEVIMFFVIKNIGEIHCTVSQYWLKYIAVPIFLVFTITVIGYVILTNKKVTDSFKQYCISLLFGSFAFILSFVHSGFVAVLACSMIPVLMTTMYEKKALTSIIAIFSIMSQFVSGYIVFWDPAKVLDSSYFVNMLILMAATFCIWLTCIFMIDFMKMKREIVISNDIERYRLQEKINIDGLTNVGNRLALMERLENKKIESGDISFLAMMDVDDFKKINDTYGHMFGDDVLRCLGAGMLKLQGTASSFRYGGDEFCMLFSEQSKDAVLKTISNIQKYVKNNIKNANCPDDIFISVGISELQGDISPSILLQWADNALYDAKKTRRGTISIHNEETITEN